MDAFDLPDPVVSVITPNFNGCRFLERCIESVRRQEFSVEHIIVDDCSHDDSWLMLQRLAARYPWVKPIRLADNSGPVHARNRAIDEARGRFVAFLDVDDFWVRDKLSKQVNFMMERGVALSFSDYRFVSEDGKLIGRRLQGFDSIGWHLHHMTRYLGCLTVIVDRLYVPDFSIPEIKPATRAEDFLSWSNIIREHGAAVRCPYDLARYSVVRDSRSAAKMGSVSVWRLYRNVEGLSFVSSALYFSVYALGVFWKRYRFKPVLPRSEVDSDFEWSLVGPGAT